MKYISYDLVCEGVECWFMNNINLLFKKYMCNCYNFFKYCLNVEVNK